LIEEFAKLHNKGNGKSSGSPTTEDPGTEYRIAVKKVELPPFDGEDRVGWITRAKTYFEVQGSSEEVKVRLAKLSMEGATIHWFNLLCETDDDLTWVKLKRALIDRYGGHKSDNPFEELKDLMKTGSVEEYMNEFSHIFSSSTIA